MKQKIRFLLFLFFHVAHGSASTDVGVLTGCTVAGMLLLAILIGCYRSFCFRRSLRSEEQRKDDGGDDAWYSQKVVERNRKRPKNEVQDIIGFEVGADPLNDITILPRDFNGGNRVINIGDSLNDHQRKKIHAPIPKAVGSQKQGFSSVSEIGGSGRRKRKHENTQLDAGRRRLANLSEMSWDPPNVQRVRRRLSGDPTKPGYKHMPVVLEIQMMDKNNDHRTHKAKNIVSRNGHKGPSYPHSYFQRDSADSTDSSDSSFEIERRRSRSSEVLHSLRGLDASMFRFDTRDTHNRSPSVDIVERLRSNSPRPPLVQRASSSKSTAKSVLSFAPAHSALSLHDSVPSIPMACDHSSQDENQEPPPFPPDTPKTPETETPLSPPPFPFRSRGKTHPAPFHPPKFDSKTTNDRSSLASIKDPTRGGYDPPPYKLKVGDDERTLLTSSIKMKLGTKSSYNSWSDSGNTTSHPSSRHSRYSVNKSGTPQSAVLYSQLKNRRKSSPQRSAPPITGSKSRLHMMAQFSEYFEESEPIKPKKISIAAVVSKQDSKPSEKIELNSLHVEKTPIYEIVTGSILSIDEELTESSEHPSERPFRLLRSVSTIVNSVLGTMPDDSDSEKSTISRLASTPMSQVVEGILLNVMPDNPLQIEEVEEECELSGWKFPRKLTTKRDRSVSFRLGGEVFQSARHETVELSSDPPLLKESIEEEVTEECESDCEDPQMSQLILATKRDRSVSFRINGEVFPNARHETVDSSSDPPLLKESNDTVSDNTALKPQTHLDFPATRREKRRHSRERTVSFAPEIPAFTNVDMDEPASAMRPASYPPYYPTPYGDGPGPIGDVGRPRVRSLPYPQSAAEFRQYFQEEISDLKSRLRKARAITAEKHERLQRVRSRTETFMSIFNEESSYDPKANEDDDQYSSRKGNVFDLNDQLENLESTIQKLKANHLADLASLKQKLSELRDNVSEHEDEAATVQL